jgi:uncharacterized RDD family membrane protein YckC
MSCPICGDECHCASESKGYRGAAKPRFEPDPKTAASPAAVFLDPEAYDAGEQPFAARLDERPPAPRFLVQRDEDADSHSSAESGESVEVERPPAENNRPAQDGGAELHESTAWREEVAARLDRYRSRRRPRQPRYPSLHLKFDNDPGNFQHEPATAIITQQALVHESFAEAPLSQTHAAPLENAVEPSGRILEFPRSSLVPPRQVDELAEPVFDRPRILEAPETPPIPPALGGILIEAPEKIENERRPGFEIPLKYASMSRRLYAASVDVLFVGSAAALFFYLFLQITAAALPLKQTALMAMAVAGSFWAGYQYLFLLYSAETPGLKFAGLRLSRFDDTPVPRPLRRWRALAAILSGLSLGLGYAWCFLDEDQLCWHDRITKTYMAPKA